MKVRCTFTPEEAREFESEYGNHTVSSWAAYKSGSEFKLKSLAYYFTVTEEQLVFLKLKYNIRVEVLSE